MVMAMDGVDTEPVRRMFQSSNPNDDSGKHGESKRVSQGDALLNKDSGAIEQWEQH